MSREVARLAGHLKDLMDDASSEDGVYPVPIVTASTLRALVRMPEMLSARSVPGVHRMEQYQNKSFEELRYEGYASNSLSPSSDEHSLLQLMEHVEGALFLDAPMLLKHNQSVIASLVNGKNADELRALLGAGSDFDGAELEAALAESAFLPEGYEAPQQLGAASSTAPLAPLRQPSLSGVPATTDASEAALEMVDVATLCELKGVNRVWRALSRHVLCSRLCRGRGQPAPTHLEEITDLDVELLIEAGRPGDTALAGRMLPWLARLHGYGCVVDVAKVRAANLQNGDVQRGPSWLGGTAKAALDSCISGDGEAPLKLTIAAVACAGSGVACGIPVQHMREDTMTELDLRIKGLRGPAAMLISYLIPAYGSLTSLNLSGNQLCDLDAFGVGTYTAVGIAAIADALRVNGGLTSLDLSKNALCGLVQSFGGVSGTYTAEGITAIADALRVNGGLTRVDVRHNNIAGDGAAQLAAAVLGNLKIEMFNEIPINEMRADSFTELDLNGKGVGVEGGMVVAGLIPVMGGLTSLNLSDNQLCGLDRHGRGTYTAEGIAAIADTLRVNGGLTALDLSYNGLRNEGVSAVCEAIQSNKETKLASLNMTMNRIGRVGAKSVAALVAVTGSLTVTNLLGNQLDAESAKMLAEVTKQKGISLCGIRRDQTTTAFHHKWLEPPDAILLASDLSQTVVTGALTSLDLSDNTLCGVVRTVSGVSGTYTAKGITAIADALRVNGGLTSLDLSNNLLCGVNILGRGTYTAEGITAIAEALRVNGALTKLWLADNNLQEEGIFAICEALEQNTTLKELNISGGRPGNNIGGSAGAKHVAKMVGINGGLTSIDLSGNQLCGIWEDWRGQQGTYTAEGITAIADALRVNGALTSVKLRGNWLGDEGWGAIFAAICGNKDSKIMSMDASSENIGPADVKLIAEALRTSVTGGLTSIDLSGNQLCGIWTDDDGDQKGTYTAEGITAIADTLRVNGGLTSINMSGNNLTDSGRDMTGIKELAAALGVNGVLTSLDLSSNDLKDEGVSAVCEAIQSNKETKLASLNMSENRIGPVGAKSVAAMVAVTGVLTSLDLSFNDLNDEGVSAVCEAIQSNKETKLASLNMGANRIGPVGAKSVAAMVAITGALTKME